MPEKSWRFRPARDLELTGEARRRSARRESGLLETFTQSAWGLGLRAYLRVWHRWRVVGRERIPRQLPFVLAANHTSHLDTIALSCVLRLGQRPGVFPLAAGDHFFESPAMSRFSTWFVNALPVWRGRAGAHDLAELRLKLQEDPCGFILFPEGTRSRNGELGRFRAGVGRLVAASDVPVLPCHLEGAYAALPSHRRVPRPGRLTLRIGTPLSFADLPDRREGWDEVATRLETSIRALAIEAETARRRTRTRRGRKP